MRSTKPRRMHPMGRSAKDKIMLALASVLLAGAPANSQPVDFKGKQIKVLIGMGPGGGYDQYGRLVAAHIGRHLPGNPTVVPQNLPGGGSLLVAQKIYLQSPKDGTEWGIVARDLIIAPLTQPNMKNAFDGSKFSWLGSPDTETNICIVNASTGITSAQDLLTKELVVAATGLGSGSYIYPTVLNGLVGTKFKVVTGYPSAVEAFLAMERHEVEGACDSYSSVIRKSGQAIKEGKIRVLFWAGTPIPEVASLPHVTSLVTKHEDQEMIDFIYGPQTFARPFIAPPNLPAPVYTVLKAAFAAAIRDPLLIADAAKQGMDLRSASAEATAEMVQKVYATPPEIIERMSSILRDGKSPQ
jgi:tripartite-type tricarboxylate transporter receptor subunit TctC